MTVRFWGVRGSIPSPSASTVRYGGNTSCVTIDLGSSKTLVLDAGTGIRVLGRSIEKTPSDIFILLSHIHWDHIQGFPFFTPIYQPHRVIYMFPTIHVNGKAMLSSLIAQMDGAYFPLKPDKLPSRCQFVNEDAMVFLFNHGFGISRILTNHPGGGYGYCIENAGRSVVYLTDNELNPPYEKTTTKEDFVRFCENKDVLIHDAQYTERDMPHKHGWGHSLVVQACELAAEANVKLLILYHHDPDRTDDELDEIQEFATAWFKKNKSSTRCTVAYEGLVLEL